MKTIFKYELALIESQILSLPADAEILDIQLQNSDICAWVKVDTDKPVRDRTILIKGTGDQLETPQTQHLKTIQMGHMVWHFFEVL